MLLFNNLGFESSCKFVANINAIVKSKTASYLNRNEEIGEEIGHLRKAWGNK